MIYSVSFLLVFTISTSTEGWTKHHEISLDHVFSLDCDKFVTENSTVSWILGKEQILDVDNLPARMKLINKSLWFLPAKPWHSGNYSCDLREESGKKPIIMKKQHLVSVVNHTCPPVNRKSKFLTLETSDSLNCGSDHIRKILELHPHSHVTWMKDCSPLDITESNPRLRFMSVKESDGGGYTCIVNFTFEGNFYTAAQSMKVFINHVSVPQEPRVLKPSQTTDFHTVTVGLRHEMNCRAFVGTDKDGIQDTYIYWLVNGTFVDDFPQILVNETQMTEKNTNYVESTLTILEVQTEFLYIPFTCVVMNTKGSSNGTVILILASQKDHYIRVALSIAFTAALLGVLVFHLFRVELVLAYRKFPCLKIPSDGKLYDAYISYFHGYDQCMCSAKNLALHTLPEVLEDRLGYNLFISGRDEIPGAVHEVITEALGKSRRLIILLTPQAFKESAKVGRLQDISAEHLNVDNNNPEVHPDLFKLAGTCGSVWGPYEWWLGLHDALIKGGLKVILIQVEEGVNEEQLPESLRYIIRTQGILHWKQDYASKPNGKFWKQLRYHMPHVQKAKRNAVV
ncbi:interleukin-1 receptor type 1 isoform X2 [Hoplias malabaricus]|uniref:interleukin-1 receptor type 1 isoform X2 n=1 Tax=Hoplias malabaricus TaxID=27720 RepID=UPI003462CB10